MTSRCRTQPHCLVEQDGHKLIVTMNRPEARNALSGEMLAIMSDAWDRVNDDPEIRVCILTGAGGYFCAGMDLKAADKKPPSESFESGDYDPTIIKPLLKGFRLTKPLIAAVEGPAIAGGTEILQGTDIRIAGESAKFGVSEAKWSLYPMGGSAVRLVRQIPYTVAADLLLTGRHILAPEAKELGLIGHVVPDGQALAKAHEIADLVAANGPLAVQAILKTMRDSEGRHEDDCWADDARIGAAVFSSEDAKEGPRAFSEKRPAQFKGTVQPLTLSPVAAGVVLIFAAFLALAVAVVVFSYLGRQEAARGDGDVRRRAGLAVRGGAAAAGRPVHRAAVRARLRAACLQRALRQPRWPRPGVLRLRVQDPDHQREADHDPGAPVLGRWGSPWASHCRR